MTRPHLTVKDVASRLGVSPSTVSRVLNDDPRISAATAARVRLVIAETGFTPNPFARGLKTNQSRTIGFVAPEFTNDFFMGIAEGVESRLRDEGYHLIISHSRETTDGERESLKTLLERGVDGLVVIPASASGSHWQGAAAQGVPVVLVDRLVADFSTDSVLVDNVNGTYEAVESILSEGFTRIGFLGGDPGLTSASERFDGYKRALGDYRVPLADELIRFGDFHQDSGYALMAELTSLPQPPQWVFVSNLFMHAGATRYLMDHRLDLVSVPSIASFDEMPFAFSLGFCRRFVRQPIQGLGVRAAEFLLERISGAAQGAARTARLKTELIRNS